MCGDGTRLDRARIPDCGRKVIEIVRSLADHNQHEVGAVVDSMRAGIAEQAVEQGCVNDCEVTRRLIVAGCEHPNYVYAAALLQHDHSIGKPSRGEADLSRLLAEVTLENH